MKFLFIIVRSSLEIVLYAGKGTHRILFVLRLQSFFLCSTYLWCGEVLLPDSLGCELWGMGSMKSIQRNERTAQTMRASKTTREQKMRKYGKKWWNRFKGIPYRPWSRNYWQRQVTNVQVDMSTHELNRFRRKNNIFITKSVQCTRWIHRNMLLRISYPCEQLGDYTSQASNKWLCFVCPVGSKNVLECIPYWIFFLILPSRCIVMFMCGKRNFLISNYIWQGVSFHKKKCFLSPNLFSLNYFDGDNYTDSVYTLQSVQPKHRRFFNMKINDRRFFIYLKIFFCRFESDDIVRTIVQ